MNPETTGASEGDRAVFDAALDRTGHFGIAHDEMVRAGVPEGERCEWCNGTGNELYAMYRRCPKCGGTGRVDPARGGV